MIVRLHAAGVYRRSISIYRAIFEINVIAFAGGLLCFDLPWLRAGIPCTVLHRAARAFPLGNGQRHALESLAS
jgi:hypothetical protein